MLRRVVSHARRLGVTSAVLPPLVEATVELMGDAYPELRENRAFIQQVAGSEEERFAATLNQGMRLFGEAAARTQTGGAISGDDAFKLSDTFGFPLQLTQELAEEAGLRVDVDRFGELLEEQRRRARESAKKIPIGFDTGAVPPSEFVGYGHLDAEGRIVAMLDTESRELPVAEEGDEVRVFLDVTPFYAEGGGQIGDQGTIRTDTGLIRVNDTQRAGPHAIMHTGKVESGEVRGDQEAHGEVDAIRREATARAHTSTHIVHWTLKHLLGEHARQAGSLVAPGRLRFDFPHPSAVPQEVLEEAEAEANRRLALDDAVRIIRDHVRRGEGPGRDRALRREVRRPGSRGRGRGLLARAVRWHARSSDRQRRVDPDPPRGIDRRGDATRRSVGRPRCAPRDQRRAGAPARRRGGARQHRPPGCGRARPPAGRTREAPGERARQAEARRCRLARG